MTRLSALEEHLTRWVAHEHPALPGRTNHKRAGVAVPLREVEGDVEVWLTQRPLHLRRHPGQVSFPGGAPDPDDRSLELTARRELLEEVGVGAGRRIGRLSSMPLYTSDWRLEPFVFLLDPGAPSPDPNEVAQVLQPRIGQLLALPQIEAIPFDWDGMNFLSPVFRLGEHLCYGGTAYTLLELLEVAAPVWGVPVPERVASGLTWDDLR